MDQHNMLIQDLVDALRGALSAHGRTVGQAWDDVPLEPWEAKAREVLDPVASILERESS